MEKPTNPQGSKGQRVWHVLLAIVFIISGGFLGAIWVNVDGLLVLLGASSSRLSIWAVAVLGVCVVVSSVLLITRLGMKLLGGAVAEDAVKAIATISGNKDSHQKFEEQFKALSKVLRLLFRGLFLGFACAVLIVFAQILFSIVNTISNQQQVQKFSEQNKLSKIQQKFEMTSTTADRQFDEIRIILLDPDATIGQQIYALKELPTAMSAEVITAWDPDSVSESTSEAYHYPNIDRLRNVLRQYMKTDRTTRVLAPPEPTSSNQQFTSEELRSIKVLRPVTAQLMETIHLMGIQVTREDKPDWRESLWRVSGATKPARTRLKFSPQVETDGEYDLTHIHPYDWENCQLPYLTLDRKRFDRIIFVSNSVFRSANLVAAKLQLSQLKNADFSSANLQAANLSGARFDGANLDSSNITSANLWATQLPDASLRYVKAKGTNLERTNFEGANLSEANLSGSKISYANLKDCNLYGTVFRGSEIIWSDFAQAKAQRSNFSSARLSAVNFSAADLQNSAFHGTKVNQSQFSQANLSKSEFACASIVNSTLRQANMQGSFLPGTIILDTDLRGVDFRAADFSGQKNLFFGTNNFLIQHGTSWVNFSSTNVIEWSSDVLDIDWSKSPQKDLLPKFLSLVGQPDAIQKLDRYEEIQKLVGSDGLVAKTEKLQFFGKTRPTSRGIYAADSSGLLLDQRTSNSLISYIESLEKSRARNELLKSLSTAKISDREGKQYLDRLKHLIEIRTHLQDVLSDYSPDVNFFFLDEK